jgi:hypothetical protein
MRLIKFSVAILAIGGALTVSSYVYMQKTYSLLSVGGFQGELVAPARIVERGYPFKYLRYTNRLDADCMSLDLNQSFAKDCKKSKIVSTDREIIKVNFIEDWALYSLLTVLVIRLTKTTKNWL